MTLQALQKVSSTGWDWDEMRSFCFNQALHVVHCPNQADEAAQEAIVRAWRHREKCREPEQPFGWLRRIAQNEAIRVARRRPQEVLVDEPLVFPGAATASDESMDARLLLGDILKQLSETDRELARLRYYEDLTCAKLADHFGLTEGTVKVRLHRLRQRLKERLEDQT
jgi:RNA polymerase sigma-70 factor (ECF subfamily)